MKYKLKEKKVDVISWNDLETQGKAMTELAELGCTEIVFGSSGAGDSIGFKYPTPNESNPYYMGHLFYGHKMVFSNDGKYPSVYDSKHFEELFEEIKPTTFIERLETEVEELATKITALNKALDNENFITKVGAFQFELLCVQHSTMVAYRRILDIRIKDLKNKEIV